MRPFFIAGALTASSSRSFDLETRPHTASVNLTTRFSRRLQTFMQKHQRDPDDGLPSPTLPPPPNENQSNNTFNFKNPYKLEAPLADMSAVPRSESISSSITPGNEWASMNGFGNAGRSGSPYSPSLSFNRGDLVTPPQTGSANGAPYSNAKGGFQPEPHPVGLGLNGQGRPSDSHSLGPSPPVSIANSRRRTQGMRIRGPPLAVQT